jgi:Polyketide cyclase / dehydrase and lipid transport
MDLDASLDAPCPPTELFAWVEDLTRYPHWLSIVTRAEPDASGGWVVDLRGRFGPLARSKRLRMIRTALEPDHLVVFERVESDGRDHSPWILRAAVEPRPAGSRLEMRLHYGGGLWASMLERMVRDEIEQSRARLLALVSGRTR